MDQTDVVALSLIPFPGGMPARNIQSNETRSGGATVGRPSGAPGRRLRQRGHPFGRDGSAVRVAPGEPSNEDSVP